MDASNYRTDVIGSIKILSERVGPFDENGTKCPLMRKIKIILISQTSICVL